MNLFSVILFIFSLSATANYQWINTTNKPFAGQCIKIHDSNIKQKVEETFCRPKSLFIVFNDKNGFCYEVSEKKNIYGYFKKIDLEHCKTKNLKVAFNVINNKYSCYEYDAKSGGKLYYKRLKNKDCDSSQLTYYWKHSKNGGDCFFKNNSGEFKKVLKTKCRPQEVNYKFIRTSPLQGRCVEQDQRGQNYYTAKSKLDNCRPGETEFIYLRNDKGGEGKCFEVDTQTKGDLFIKKSKLKQCL